MPIYAYRCEACGFAKDVLQKISDAPLSDCPSCGKAEFRKQVTAAGFQLKGTGWYVTDFRGGSNNSASGNTSSTTSTPTPAKTDSSGSTAASGASDSKPATTAT